MSAKKINQVFLTAALGVFAGVSSGHALTITLSDSAPTDGIEISSLRAVDPGVDHTRTSSGPDLYHRAGRWRAEDLTGWRCPMSWRRQERITMNKKV